MPLARTRLCLLLAMLGLAGCDALFGLGRLDDPKDGGVPDVPIDGALPPCKRGYPSVPLVEIPTGTYRSTSGDFNKDGKQDLAIASSLTDTVEILNGNGDGTFAPARSYSARNAPMAIVTADLDADGDLDIVVANDAGTTVAGQVSVLLGNGDGTFAAPTNSNGAGIQPRALVIGDFDKDGKLDIVVGNYTSNNVGVMLGNGNGTFAAQVVTTVGTTPYGVVTADFNEDGKPDLATANVGDAKVAVLINSSSGPGNIAFTITKPAVQAGPLDLAVGDLDDNGHVDLVVANATANTTSILLGAGNGTFATAVSYPVGTSPRSIAVLDVDHDGKLDVVAGNSGQGAGMIVEDGTLSWLRGTGTGAVAAAVMLPTVVAPIWMTLADFDNDMNVDLAVLSRDFGFAHILLDPTGALPVASRLPATQPIRGAAADLDGDNRSDLAIASYGGAKLELFVSGGGVLATHTPLTASASPHSLVLADVDGDAIADLIVTHFTPAPGTVGVRKGLGDGAFAATATPYNVVAYPGKIVAGDLDNDGDLDLVVVGYNTTGTMQVLRNNGAGTFTVEAALTMGGDHPLDGAVYDFNKDGRLDLVASHSMTNNVGVRLATGATTYGNAIPHTSIDVEPMSLAIADLDHNGKADVILANHGAGTIGVLSGTGDGTFATVGAFPTTASPWGIALGDFDGDDVLDAVTTSDSRHVLTIAHGLGDGRFGELQSYPAGLTPTMVVVGDYDGDGYPDFAVTNRGGDSVSVMLDRCLK